MKRIALITTLLLGAAPMVSAQTYRDTDSDRRFDESHRRIDEGHQARHAGWQRTRERAGWVPLATMDVTRKQTVDFPRNNGRFQTLRLRAIHGVSYLDFVEVRYGNGEQQHVDVRHVIGGDEDIDIAVNGRHVEAITVHGGPNPRDRYSRRAEITVFGIR